METIPGLPTKRGAFLFARRICRPIFRHRNLEVGGHLRLPRPFLSASIRVVCGPHLEFGLHSRDGDGAEIFTLKKQRHAEYWMAQAFPVLLVLRNSEGEVRWMEVRDWLKRASDGGKKRRRGFDTSPSIPLPVRGGEGSQ